MLFLLTLRQVTYATFYIYNKGNKLKGDYKESAIRGQIIYKGHFCGLDLPIASRSHAQKWSSLANKSLVAQWLEHPI